MKRALITGITGQDGAYLAELLLEKGYEVHGIKRRASSFNTDRIDHLYQDPHAHVVRMSPALRRSDRRDQSDPHHPAGAAGRDLQPRGAKPRRGLVRDPGIHRQCRCARHAAAARGDSHSRADAKNALLSGFDLGDVRQRAESPQRETTPFYPRSPYGAAKVYAYWITVNYREAYGMFACNGILFNHESPGARRDLRDAQDHPRACARCTRGSSECLYLGNLDARRDWGHARDFVRAQWLMLQQERPEDFVIATGEQHSVREFCEHAARHARHAARVARQRRRGVRHRRRRAAARSSSIDPRYFRPTEVDTLLGRRVQGAAGLGWQPQISFDQLVQEMVARGSGAGAQRDALVAREGFKTYRHHE